MFNRRPPSLHDIDPDEVFLDATNLPEFNTHQFEGRLEKPISKGTIALLGFFFLVIALLFTGKLVTLQITEGEEYRALSENNHLRHVPLFAERGVVLDRNREELVWNTPFTEKEEDFSHRQYTERHGFAHILGYVQYPSKDKAGFYYRMDFEGKDGIEHAYNDELNGEQGLKILEANALGGLQSENTIRPVTDGENIILTIDADLQERLYTAMSDLSDEVGFVGGAGAIMDVETGALLALSSFPEYNGTILSEGSDNDAINSYITDERNLFLNRAISGLYTPGSIVKPIVALGALNEGVITPTKKILSTESISLPHPYFPDLFSVFTDWKAHGLVDMIDALAVSSNIYFYEVGGGFENQEGIGIEKIARYMELFGLGYETGVDVAGEKEGVIPNPAWKREVFDDDWRIGDTYNTAIGQYGFQITPIQGVRAVAAIANGGYLVTPHLVSGVEDNETGRVRVSRVTNEKIPYIDDRHYNTIHEGMRQAVTSGTAKGLNIPAVRVAAKTGTAEIGRTKKLVNSWITGFFPYDNPRYAFTVVMEKGPRDNLIGALFVMRQVLEWMGEERPEYLVSNE